MNKEYPKNLSIEERYKFISEMLKNWEELGKKYKINDYFKDFITAKHKKVKDDLQEFKKEYPEIIIKN